MKLIGTQKTEINIYEISKQEIYDAVVDYLFTKKVYMPDIKTTLKINIPELTDKNEIVLTKKLD